MVFDRIVRAPGQHLRNVRPPVAQLPVRIKQSSVLLDCPVVLLDGGVKLVVPALAALLSRAPWKVRCDHRPALRAVLLDEAAHLGILFRRPHAAARVLALTALILVVAGEGGHCAAGERIRHELRRLCKRRHLRQRRAILAHRHIACHLIVLDGPEWPEAAQLEVVVVVKSVTCGDAERGAWVQRAKKRASPRQRRRLCHVWGARSITHCRCRSDQRLSNARALQVCDETLRKSLLGRES